MVKVTKPQKNQPTLNLDKMKKSILFALVIAEATALKKSATSAEIAHLNFNRLTPIDHKGCIYGQMTGSCFSPRATKLIESCAPKFIEAEIGDEITELEDCKLTETHERHTVDDEYYFSPIEVLISQPKTKGNAERLIAFLKGETEVLKLK